MFYCCLRHNTLVFVRGPAQHRQCPLDRREEYTYGKTRRGAEAGASRLHRGALISGLNEATARFGGRACAHFGRVPRKAKLRRHGEGVV